MTDTKWKAGDMHRKAARKHREFADQDEQRVLSMKIEAEMFPPEIAWQVRRLADIALVRTGIERDMADALDEIARLYDEFGEERSDD
jgi:hypothetical protein